MGAWIEIFLLLGVIIWPDVAPAWGRGLKLANEEELA